MTYTPRLKEKYSQEIISSLTEKFGYKTVMKVPRLQKIVLSQGMGDAVADKKLIDRIEFFKKKISKVMNPPKIESGKLI